MSQLERAQPQGAGDGACAGHAHAQPWSWRTLLWWPTAAGLAFAAFVAFDLFGGGERGVDLGPIVAASGLVYLGAAAAGRPWLAWPVFFASVAVITLGEFGLMSVDPTWVLLVLAAAFLVYGLLRRGGRPGGGLSTQSIAMIAFGAVAAVALAVDAVVGAFLVAGGLLAHAGWDAYHHWSNKAVTRSMAEFCFVLDVTLAGAILVATLAPGLAGAAG